MRRRLPGPVLAALRGLGRRAEELGGRAWLVGGTVRDLLLERPTSDVDVVVDRPIERVVRGLGGRLRPYATFGTATLTLGGSVRVDLARARTESYARPAALPRVAPASLEDDVGRRDFTINALAVELGPARFGRLVGHLEGLTDLQQGRVRVLHERSFLDDPTRVFRAAALAARLGFDIERETARLIREASRARMYDRLSAARLRGALERMLGESEAGEAVRLLRRYGVLRSLSSSWKLPRGILDRLGRVDASIEWFGALPPESRGTERPRGWVVKLGLLIQELTPPAADGLLERLRPDRRAREALRSSPVELRRLRRRLSTRRALRPSVIYRTCHDRPTELLLMALSDPRGARVRRGVARFLEEIRSARPDVTGRDLLAAGIPPGPAVARGLAAALAAKLDGGAAGAPDQLRIAIAAARHA